MSVKLDETRKYYTMYNMLDRKKQYLVKEDSLLGSMESNFAASMKVRISSAPCNETQVSTRGCLF